MANYGRWLFGKRIKGRPLPLRKELVESVDRRVIHIASQYAVNFPYDVEDLVMEAIVAWLETKDFYHVHKACLTHVRRELRAHRSLPNYLPKVAHEEQVEDELVEVIWPYLSRVEKNIVRCLYNGLSKNETAEKLGLSPRVVSYHLGRMECFLTSRQPVLDYFIATLKNST